MRHLLALILAIVATSLTDAAVPVRNYHAEDIELRDTTIALAPCNVPPERLLAEGRVAMMDLKQRRGESADSWGITMPPAAGCDSIKVWLTWANSDFGDITDSRYATVSIRMGDSLLAVSEAPAMAMNKGRYNSLGAVYDCTDNSLTVRGGHSKRSEIARVTVPEEWKPEGSAVLTTRGRGHLALFVTETSSPMETPALTGWSAEELGKKLEAAPASGVEGIWQYLDRDTDPKYAKPGGKYLIAVVRSGEDTYDVLYLANATVLADRWKPLMRKGTLRRTIFTGNYDLTWLDSEFEPLTDDMHADLTVENSVLALNFPIYKAILRFSRVPAEKSREILAHLVEIDAH